MVSIQRHRDKRSVIFDREEEKKRKKGNDEQESPKKGEKKKAVNCWTIFLEEKVGGKQEERNNQIRNRKKRGEGACESDISQTIIVEWCVRAVYHLHHHHHPMHRSAQQPHPAGFCIFVNTQATGVLENVDSCVLLGCLVSTLIVPFLFSYPPSISF